jgi:endonuclease/exonuclease/phosphatase family metal-dependent hydrolase
MANRLRVITYNIHRCIGVDRKVSLVRISDAISVHQPDVVALQEVDFGQVRPARYDQAAKIAERLNFSPIWIERERCGNAILSRYPMKMVKAGGLHKPRRWHAIARRGALWVEVEAYGTSIQVINTHLGLTPASRLNQARLLVGQDWLGSPECRPPVILCGDFNTQSGSTVFRLFEGRFRKVGGNTVRGQAEKTWPSAHPMIGIDHMFISGDLAVETVTVPVNGTVRMASDHLPLFAEISLPDKVNQTNQPRCGI